MGKKKSAVFLILIAVIVLGLCFICTVSFPYGTDNMYTFNSVVGMMRKDAYLGGMLLDGENYLGGGYSAVYYPEGVISASEYEDNLAALTDTKEIEEYKETYVRYPDANGSVYLERKTACGEDGKVSDSFKEDFSAAVKLMKERISRMRLEGTSMEVRDDFTVRMTLPALFDAQSVVFNTFLRTGDFSMGYGSDAATAEKVNLRSTETINDYVKGAASRSRRGTPYVMIKFTEKGRDTIAEWTETADDTSVTLFFYVGDEAVISLPVSSAIDQKTLYISGNYTAESARAVAVTMDTALNGTSTSLGFTLKETVRSEATFGNWALIALYIAFGAAFLGMMIFFFVRYHMLAFAHLYTFLIYFVSMVLCVWAIPFLHFGIETLIAVALGGILLSVTDAMSYEIARGMYATGKTMTSCVKAANRRMLLPVIDISAAIALFGFVAYFIALTEVSLFAFTFALGAVLSALLVIAVNRFCWAALLATAKNPGPFCNFVKEADDE